MPSYSIDTELVDVAHTDQHHAAVEPIYQSATFHQEGLSNFGEYDYTRSGNPTRTTLERHLAKIMGNATRVYATNSGMGAIDVICRLLGPSDEVVAGLDLYGGSSRLLEYMGKTLGLKSHHVDTTQVDEVAKVLNENTRLVLLESPTNPGMGVCDVSAISRAVRAHPKARRAIIAFDNTMMSPINMNPFELGADIWMESATKYLSGHHDLMGGVLAVQDKDLADKLGFVINANGSGLAPFDSWLLLRGIKTLGVRFEKQQSNAIKIADWLEQIRPQLVLDRFDVVFPGLKSHPQYERHAAQSKGPGAVMSLRTYDTAVSEKIVDATRLFKISVSFGAVTSLISLPIKMSHAGIDAETRAARGFPEDVVRLCIGIENADDLIADLEQAFITAGILKKNI